MLKFGNKEFRNLQEQVLKNMRDIQNIMQGTTVLAEFGIKVIGQVDTAAELPDPATYEGEYGDAYIVGTEEPYEYYIFTRAFEGQEEPSWFDLGIFPVPGPQGETGPVGPVGPQGQTGNPGTDGVSAGFGTITATAQTLVPGSSATATVVASGPNTEKSFAFTFGIPRGEDGTSGVWGDITGDIEDQTDLVNALQSKQDTLVSGTNIKTISDNSILGSGNIKISQLQATATIVIDALTNLNGRIISSFEATLDTSTSHTFYVITKGGNQLTEEQARDYMEYMTGSRFLPVYDYETPENSIFIFANGSLWKPQYDLFGLKLYALPNPYASKVDLTNYVDLSSTQRISGNKNFSKAISITDSNMPVGYVSPSSTPLSVVDGLAINKNGFSITGKNNGDSHTNITYNLPPYLGTGTKNYTIATTDDIPTATSDLTNDSGFITSSYLSGYAKLSGRNTFTGVSNTFVNSILANMGLYSGSSSAPLYFGHSSTPTLALNPGYLAPVSNSGLSLGNSSYKWSNLYLSGTLRDGSNANYGLSLPDTTSFTANKTIATTDQVDAKQDILTFDSTPTQNSTNPVTSGGIWSALDTVKKDSYIPVDITTYPTLADFLASSGEEGYMYLYPIDTTDLTKGYYRYIWENSAWLNLGTTAIDLSNYVDLSSTQTITGAKTFTTGVIMKNNVGVKYGNTYGNGFTICNDGSGGLLFKNNYNVSKYHFTDSNLYPDVSGAGSLGSSTRMWGDLYLSGNLSNGTNSISIANIANKNNFITLTQAEYDALATKDPDTLYFIEEE